MPLAILVLATAVTPSLEFEARIASLAKAHKGRVAVAIKNLKSGECHYLDADEVMPTASLIKLPVMVEAYWQAEEKKVRFDTMLTLAREDRVPGSGVLTPHFSDGASFPLRDAVRLMIVFSDNTATNMVLDRIGIPSTNTRMAKLGLTNTRIHAKVFKGDTTSIDPAATARYGLGATTAREMVRLLECLDGGTVVSPAACKEMLKHLEACEDKTTFARFLPTGMKLAHKTGAVSDVRTGAGIVQTLSGPVAFCVLTAGNEDRRWSRDNSAEVLLATIAREVYQHFGPPVSEPKK
jgi:beta-lactamase class A